MRRRDRAGGARRAAPGRRAIAAVVLALPLLAAAPGERGDPGSKLPATNGASEYWDVVARFDSGHRFFVRFMVTNEGPGENTGIAYGHLIDPDGAAHFFSNGRREGRWQLDPRGRRLEIGSSELDLSGPELTLAVHKRRKGVDIDLRIRPEGPALWNRSEHPGEPKVDLLAASAPIAGTAWFRGMPQPVPLHGRAGVTHTWMDRSEPEIALRRLDFFSLGDETAVYLRDFEAVGGSRSRWLAITRGGEAIFESAELSLTPGGTSAAQRDRDYPLPAVVALGGRNLHGEIRLGSGLLHHDPMTVMPQPFRFLLSWKLRPHRVWTDSVFEVTYPAGSESVTIRGAGIAGVTFLNPIPSKTSMTSPPNRGD